MAEAQRRAHQAAAAGDVTVELLDGTYRLAAPLRFDAADSGRDGHTVTWKAACGAKPALSGAKPVTGWKPEADGVYKVQVGTGFDGRQVYVDGVLAQRAQLTLPDGWRAVPAGDALKPELSAGASTTATWKVTAPASVAKPVERAPVTLALAYRAGSTRHELKQSLAVTALNPLRSLKGHGSASSSGYAVMVVTPGNGLAFPWDSDGNGYLDSFATAAGIMAPAWVRLVRSGSEVGGYYPTHSRA